MVEQTCRIRNDVGLHARPATDFTKRAEDFAASVTIVKDGREANGKSLLSLLQLDIQPGDAFTLRAEGEDAEAAVSALVGLVDELSAEAGT